MFITEIFKSIQGECTRAGLPCIFVRLTGCNLRCTWRDTAYAFYGGTRGSVDALLGRLQELSSRSRPDSASDSKMAVKPEQPIFLVSVLGGGPLLRPEGRCLAQRPL